MKKIIFIFLFANAGRIYAGNEVRGGGEGILCMARDGSVASVEVLDYFEAREISKFPELNLGGEELTYQEKVAFVLNRLSKIDPILASKLDREANNFYSNFEFISHSVMEKIHDAHHLRNVANRCQIVQLAIQGDAKHRDYILDGGLWAEMSEEQKAGIVLHEIIYKLTRLNGAMESGVARFFNGFISSAEFDVLDVARYVYEFRMRVGDELGRSEYLIYKGSKVKDCTYSEELVTGPEDVTRVTCTNDSGERITL